MAEPKDKRDDLYDFAPAPKPHPAAPAQPAPAILIPAYKSATVQMSGNAEPEQIKNFYMPIWLLGAGIVIEVIAGFFRHFSLTEALIYVGVDIVLSTIIMMAGIFIAARLRQIDLGPFWIAAFKLSAISVAPSAVVSLATPALMFIPFGGIIGLLIQFVLYFALLGALFDLDESDTWYCVWIIFLIRVAVFISVLLIQWKL